MQSYLMINALFKTTEYKLETLSRLKITELSLSGSQQEKTLLLNSVSVEEGQTTPSFLPWLVLLLGTITIALAMHFSKESTLLSNNLMSAVTFLVCVFGSLALISKPLKLQIYRDSFSNNILFKLNDYSVRNNATSEFIKDLNSAINDVKETESNRINLKTNVRSQLNLHNKNVDELLNSGLIDEALYNRVCYSIHEKVFGKQAEHHVIDNVIYLNR